MLLIISASAPKPCDGAAPLPAPPSACKINANVALKIALYLSFHGSRPRSSAQVTDWVPLPSLVGCLYYHLHHESTHSSRFSFLCSLSPEALPARPLML